MATANFNIAHAIGHQPKKANWSFSKLMTYIFSTRRNTIIDKRIEKLEASMNLVWSELTVEERVAYMYNKAATLRAIQRLELLKN